MNKILVYKTGGINMRLEIYVFSGVDWKTYEKPDLRISNLDWMVNIDWKYHIFHRIIVNTIDWKTFRYAKSCNFDIIL